MFQTLDHTACTPFLIFQTSLRASWTILLLSCQMKLHASTSLSQSQAPSSKKKSRVSAPTCGDLTRMNFLPIRGLGFEEAHICPMDGHHQNEHIRKMPSAF